MAARKTPVQWCPVLVMQHRLALLKDVYGFRDLRVVKLVHAFLVGECTWDGLTGKECGPLSAAEWNNEQDACV